MKKTLLFSLMLFLGISTLSAQVVILDFENAATSTTFQYFGSTLDGSKNAIIDNPDATGINTSSMVADFVKPANSESWAGAYANPAIQTPIILTNGTTICVKVWYNEAGNLALKLENGDKPNWILTKEVTETKKWVELCFDTEENSIEDPKEPAAGGTYPGLVLFTDFGDVLSAERTYYIDDVIVEGGTIEPVDVLFAVDMNDYEGTFTTAYVSGTFNDWSGDANPLSDDDGDGVWTGTLSGISIGTHEYKFQVDNWANSESFGGFETCTITDPSGQYVNRKLVATESVELPTVCYGSCYACGQGVTITVNLGQGDITVSEEGLFIAGGSNFGGPGDFPLSDDDGDGVHSITFERELGFESFHTFTNGACPDWSCKEDIAGQDCANPDNFNDRKMGPVMQDTIINTCFGVCATNSDCGGVTPYDITFGVDMNGYEGSFTTAYVSGTFNDWSGDANPLSDDDGDGVWTGTIIGIGSGMHEYKFQLDQWANSETFTGFASCTISDPTGQYINRKLEVTENEELPVVCYESCYGCGQGITITINLGQGDIAVSEEGLFIAGGDHFGNPGDFPLSDDDGDGIHTITVEREVGFESFHTFLNGACPDWSCKENIAGQDCANPDNYNDRKMGPIMQDTIINTCFGVCTTTNTDCAAASGNITFQVDMNGYTEAFTTVYISGTLNNWSGDANPLSDNDGDGIWSVSLPLVSATYEYKFQLDNWAAQEQFADGDSCTVTAGEFVNRVLEVTGDDEIICYYWNSCEQCTPVGVPELTVDHTLFTVQPTLVQSETKLIFGDQFRAKKELYLLNALGQVLNITHLQAGIDEHLLDASYLQNGLYFINVQTEGKQQTQKIIVNR